MRLVGFKGAIGLKFYSMEKVKLGITPQENIRASGWIDTFTLELLYLLLENLQK